MARAPLPSPTPEQTSDNPEKEQARQRAAAVQQDIAEQALPGRIEGLVEFVGGCVESGHSQRLADGRPSPGPRAAGANRTQGPPAE